MKKMFAIGLILGSVAGAKLTASDRKINPTSLLTAALRGNIDQASVSLTVCIDYTVGDHKTALWNAVKYSHDALTELLIMRGANVNIQDVSSGETLLMQAVTAPIYSVTKNQRVIELLLDNRAEIDCRDASNNSALDLAKRFNNDQAVKLLRARGAKE